MENLKQRPRAKKEDIMESIWKKKTDEVDPAEAVKPVRVIHPIETFDWLKTRSERLFKELESQLGIRGGGEGAGTRLSREQEKLLKAFEGYAKDQSVIRVKFDTCDTDGNFTALTPEGILFVLPGNNFSGGGYELNKYKAAHMLGMELDLYVDKVDRQNYQIIMQKPQRGAQSVQSAKTVVLRELRKACEKAQNGGERPVVIGRIIKAEERYAIVDILNVGVMGQISVKYWKKGYTRALNTIVREGDFYRFSVLKVKDVENGKYRIYLSRNEIEDDPWDNLNFTDLESGSAVIVECVGKPYEKNYWWGKCDRLPGIELTCEYTVRFTREHDIRTGIRYLCMIKRISSGENGKKRYVSAIPFKVYREDVAKLAALKGVKTKERLEVSPDASGEGQGRQQKAGQWDEESEGGT